MHASARTYTHVYTFTNVPIRYLCIVYHTAYTVPVYHTAYTVPVYHTAYTVPVGNNDTIPVHTDTHSHKHTNTAVIGMHSRKGVTQKFRTDS